MGLLIPKSAKMGERPPFYCRICTVERFDSPDALARHVRKCRIEHEEDLHNLRMETRLPGIYETGDKERQAWVDKNRQKIIEGRASIYGEKKGFWRPDR